MVYKMTRNLTSGEIVAEGGCGFGRFALAFGKPVSLRSAVRTVEKMGSHGGFALPDGEMAPRAGFAAGVDGVANRAPARRGARPFSAVGITRSRRQGDRPNDPRRTHRSTLPESRGPPTAFSRPRLLPISCAPGQKSAGVVKLFCKAARKARSKQA